MRDIKFRAWQPHTSLHRQPGIYMVQDLVFYDGEGGGGEAFLHNYGEEAKSSEYLSDIVLMQFTGLTDKNGKDVYEGDILKTTNALTGQARIKTVSWHSTSARFGGIPLTHPYEIVGNIYETPELLK